ncbi:MAG: hypothetical protein WB611_28365, partial [Stellaceae bacterium]
RHILHLPDQPSPLNPEEPLPGELEVVALHIDGPALVAQDVEAVLDAGDEVGRGRPATATATATPLGGGLPAPPQPIEYVDRKGRSESGMMGRMPWWAWV